MIASHDSELIRKTCDSLANQKLDFKDLKAILNNEKIKDVLNKPEIETLKDSLSESLKDIDDDLILSQKGDDFKLKCLGCGHVVVLERPKALKAITKKIEDKK